MKSCIVFCILLVCVIGLFLFSQNRTTKKVEYFKQNKEQKYIIRPFSQVSYRVKQQVIEALENEWSNTGIHYNEDFIVETWQYPDILYVMTNMTNNKENFVGCVAIDRKYVFPFISHLYVQKEYRKKGHGGKLLGIAEKHSNVYKYKSVRLWCQDELIEYYKEHGWQKEGYSWLIEPLTGFTLMSKKL
jgi:GNAT superfamily N-acetyltransferase